MNHFENIKKLAGGKLPSAETVAKYVNDNHLDDEVAADLIGYFKVDPDEFVECLSNEINKYIDYL